MQLKTILRYYFSPISLAKISTPREGIYHNRNNIHLPFNLTMSILVSQPEDKPVTVQNIYIYIFKVPCKVIYCVICNCNILERT